MKCSLLILFLLGISLLSRSQGNELWYAFWEDRDSSYLMGFKDQNGQVKIEPRFMGITAATEFNHVIAVMEEEKDGSYDAYYLLKNGKRFGRDSIYVWDTTTDIEHEGLIKFRDSKTDLVGFFDSLGQVAIPARYNDARSFQNGTALVITGAKRMCWDEKTEFDRKNPCEHWSWQGGETQLIDKGGNVLIRNFDYREDLDWYSMQLSDSSSKDQIRESFLGTNGKYYSFENREKHFEQWMKQKLLNLSAENVLNADFFEANLIVWSQGEWLKTDTRKWLQANHAEFSKLINAISTKELFYQISVETPDEFYALDPAKKELFFHDYSLDQMREHPIFSLIIHPGNFTTLASLEFIKKDEHYFLYKISL